MNSFSNDSFRSKCKLEGEVMSSRPTLCVHNLPIKNKNSHVVFVWQDCFCQLILLFSLFLLLFMGSTILFGTIYRSYCTISANYIYLRYFSAKSFQFQQNKWIPNRSITKSKWMQFSEWVRKSCVTWNRFVSMYYLSRKEKKKYLFLFLCINRRKFCFLFGVQATLS